MKIIKRAELRFKQIRLNRKFKNEGLTDEVLEKQLEINGLRNKHDIPDKKNSVFEEYVQ